MATRVTGVTDTVGASGASAGANRWLIAVAGVVIQLSLGGIYGWSLFVKALQTADGHRDATGKLILASQTNITLTFTIALVVLGFAAYFGGLWMNRSGPRVVAVTAGVLYGAGVFLASFSGHNLPLLYLTYGVLGGIGLGLGYIVPIATLVKWFPDRRGLITGIAVAGFGAASAILRFVVPPLIKSQGVLHTFAILGVAYLILVVVGGLFMQNPPEGYRPAGWQPAATASTGAGSNFTFSEALRTWQWYALWGLLFINVIPGAAIISVAALMGVDIARATEAVAAGIVLWNAIANAGGRFLWAWLSDRIGRKYVFLAMYLAQAVILFIMPQAHTFGLLALLSALVILCYGGGFGTMPAFAADYFGPRNVGPIYGLMLTAWGAGGIVGPLIISSIHDNTKHYTSALYIFAVIMLLSAIIPFIVRPPVIREAAGAPGVRGTMRTARAE